MIGRALATSERFWDCSVEAGLLYVMALPQTDRDGRIPGAPRRILARCVPMSGWSVCEVTRYRDELVCAGLWLLYEDQPGREVIQVEKFHEHQPGMRPGSERYKKETASKYGPPPEDAHATHTQGGADAHASVPEGKGREEKEREDEDNTGSSSAPSARETSDLANVLLRAWPRMFREVNAQLTARGEKPVPPPALGIHEATTLAREVPCLAWFPSEALLIDELRRICSCFDQKGWPIWKASSVVKLIGQVFEGVSEVDQEPVIWQKQERPDGNGPAPAVADLVRGIGKEMGP